MNRLHSPKPKKISLGPSVVVAINVQIFHILGAPCLKTYFFAIAIVRNLCVLKSIIISVQCHW